MPVHFENNPKSDSGKISKLILEKLNTHLRPILNVNQLRNTQKVIMFDNIEKKLGILSFRLT